jgi:hypothetical protein
MPHIFEAWEWCETVDRQFLIGVIAGVFMVEAFFKRETRLRRMRKKEGDNCKL